jgi:hypothetical protein
MHRDIIIKWKATAIVGNTMFLRTSALNALRRRAIMKVEGKQKSHGLRNLKSKNWIKRRRGKTKGSCLALITTASKIAFSTVSSKFSIT